MAGEAFFQEHPVSYEAAVSFASKQYYFGYIDTAGKVALATGQGAHMDGVVINNPAAGESAVLWSAPGTICPIKAGAGGVTLGSEVTPDANSLAENAGSGDWVAGKALATLASGEQGSMLVYAPYVKA